MPATTVPELTADLAPHLGRSVVEMQRRQRMLREGGFFVRGRHGRAAQKATDDDAIVLLLGALAAPEPITAPGAVNIHAGLVPTNCDPLNPPQDLLDAAGPTLMDACRYAMKTARGADTYWRLARIEVRLAHVRPQVDVWFSPVTDGVLDIDQVFKVRYLVPGTDPSLWVRVPAGFVPTAIRTIAVVDGSIFTVMANIIDGRQLTKGDHNNV